MSRHYVIIYLASRSISHNLFIDTPMVLMWAWGFVSAQVVQHTLAILLKDLEAAEQGVLDKSLIQELAKMGTNGAHPNNIHGELLTKYRNTHMPKQHSFMVPLKHSVLGVFSRSMDIILPHELFAALYEHYHAAWTMYICPSVESIKSFWKSVKGGAIHVV